MMLFQASKFSVLLLLGMLLAGSISESAVAQAPAAAAQAVAAKAGAAQAAAGDADAAGQDAGAMVKKVGLAMGHNIATNYKKQNPDADIAEIFKGIKAAEADQLTESFLMGHNMATNYKKQNPDADVAEILKGIKAAEADQLTESFLFGYQVMSSIKSQDAGITAAQLEVGMKKAMAGESLGVSKEETEMLMTAFQRMLQQKKVAANDAEGKAYIQQQISTNANLKELSDGIYYEVLVAGEGESPSPASRVKVDYKGSLTNGEVFDTSLESRGGRPAQPAVFPVGGVIPGFSKALQAMKAGGKWRVMIPGEQAYGVRGGGGGKIGPMQTLIFELSLLEIIEPATPAIAPGNPSVAPGEAPANK